MKRIKRGVFSAHKLLSRMGILVTPVHYYSAQPDVVALERTRSLWAKRSPMPGIATDVDRQAERMLEICLPYQAETAGNATYRYAVEQAFGPGYGYIEAQALHAVIRHFKPARVIEVGSGVSTWCMLHALRLNHEESGKGSSITCIEPFPSEKLRSLESIDLVEKPVQEIDPEGIFAQLGKNDLLFIDSSHTVKPASDVNHLVLEVLPRLKPGVIVHFHDIYFPYDYSPFVLKTFFHWMESSLLRAFLIHNPHAEILFCQSQLHDARQEALREAHPEYVPQVHRDGLADDRYRPFENPRSEHFPASIYIRIS